MKEVISYSIISGVFFLIFIVLCVIAIIKKRKWFYVYGVSSLLLSLTLFFMTVYKISSKSYNRVNQSLKTVSSEYDSVSRALSRFSDKLEPRKGVGIYRALFNDTLSDCVEIINYQDQIIPKIDYAILLHFETCKDELRRITSLRDFESKKVLGSSINESNNGWFQPRKLSDSVVVFSSFDEYGNGQILYVSIDSSEVYCKDIYD